MHSFPRLMAQGEGRESYNGQAASGMTVNSGEMGPVSGGLGIPSECCPNDTYMLARVFSRVGKPPQPSVLKCYLWRLGLIRTTDTRILKSQSTADYDHEYYLVVLTPYLICGMQMPTV